VQNFQQLLLVCSPADTQQHRICCLVKPITCGCTAAAVADDESCSSACKPHDRPLLDALPLLQALL
jgi:hypothetical protein